MFFIHELQRTITLHPSYFGPHMRDYLVHKLHADVEGSCTGRYFIICVIDYDNITLGRIIPGKGDAEFTITYKAVVWRPFKGETVSSGFLRSALAKTAFIDLTAMLFHLRSMGL